MLKSYLSIYSQSTFTNRTTDYRQLHLFIYFISAITTLSPSHTLTHTDVFTIFVKCSFIKFVHTRSNHCFVDVVGVVVFSVAKCAFHISVMQRFHFFAQHTPTHTPNASVLPLFRVWNFYFPDSHIHTLSLSISSFVPFAVLYSLWKCMWIYSYCHSRSMMIHKFSMCFRKLYCVCVFNFLHWLQSPPHSHIHT